MTTHIAYPQLFLNSPLKPSLPTGNTIAYANKYVPQPVDILDGEGETDDDASPDEASPSGGRDPAAAPLLRGGPTSADWF